MDDLDESNPLYEFFHTNYSPDAYFEREGSLDEIHLRNMPKEDWKAYVMVPVTLPPGLRKYLDSDPEHQFSQEEVDAIEAGVERFHGVVAPYGISFEPQVGNRKAFCFLVEVD